MSDARMTDEQFNGIREKYKFSSMPEALLVHEMVVLRDQVAKLREYAEDSHLMGCPRDLNTNKDCDCGLDKLMAETGAKDDRAHDR